MSRASGIASVFGVGVVLMLAASPAAAQNTCITSCNCTVACTQTCMIGSETLTCEEWGVCIDSPGCTPGGECPALACTSTLNGGSNGDTMNGGSGHECINGLGGADLISGHAGDDTIHGGDGNDTMHGNSGNDCIWGDAGIDYADGGPGTDFCDAEGESNCEL
jgi:RTX calcium-binding nonapeptide repeat (4 copies)